MILKEPESLMKKRSRQFSENRCVVTRLTVNNSVFVPHVQKIKRKMAQVKLSATTPIPWKNINVVIMNVQNLDCY